MYSCTSNPILFRIFLVAFQLLIVTWIQYFCSLFISPVQCLISQFVTGMSNLRLSKTCGQKRFASSLGTNGNRCMIDTPDNACFLVTQLHSKYTCFITDYFRVILFSQKVQNLQGSRIIKMTC